MRWLGAVQAQDYAGAKWGVGIRMRRTTDAAIDQAFAEGTILRTHLLRPTWHFVTPADIRWLLALTAPRVHAANAHMYRRLGLDDAACERSSAALASALAGGATLTRTELREVIDEAGIDTGVDNRLSYLLMYAELDGLICSGPRRGRQFTYALLEERVPPAAKLSREEALAELARRYFSSRGPARVHDFAKWSGLTVTDARAGLNAIRTDLAAGVSGGEEYWFPSGRRAPRAGARANAHLLSIYDEYVSGYKGWGHIADNELGTGLTALGNALTSIIVVDGRIVGTWKRTVRRSAVAIALDIRSRLTGFETRAVEAATRTYGEFLGLAVELV